MNAPTSDDLLLMAFADGELSRRERRALEARLAADPHLQARLARLRQETAALRAAGLDLLAPPDPQGAALALRLGRRLASQGRHRRWAAGLAACACVAVGGAGALAVQKIADEANPPYAIEAAGLHMVVDADDLGDVAELSSADSRLQSRISTWVGAVVAIPRLEGQGWRLVDVQLFEAEGRRMAGLVYRNADGRWLTLSVAADPDGAQSLPREVGTIGLQARYWSDGRQSYAMLAGPGTPPLAAVADALVG